MGSAKREVSHAPREGVVAAGFPIAGAMANDGASAMGGGTVRNELSTALVQLYRQLFGRGPTRTVTHSFDAGYVTFLHDVLAPHERALIRRGRLDLVCQARAEIREAEDERLMDVVRRLTGCPVLHNAFQLQPERDLAVELFWISSAGEVEGGCPGGWRPKR
jgi:uncharacterized protein YbcI